jgi:hypothetical protein
MTKVPYIYSTVVHLTLACMINIINPTDTTIALVQYHHWLFPQLNTIRRYHYTYYTAHTLTYTTRTSGPDTVPGSSNRITLSSRTTLLHRQMLSPWTDAHYAKGGYELSTAQSHQGNFLRGMTRLMLSDNTSWALLQPLIRGIFPFGQIIVMLKGSRAQRRHIPVLQSALSLPLVDWLTDSEGSARRAGCSGYIGDQRLPLV